MKNAKAIHNLDTLEKEIYRLSVESKITEDKLDNNFGSLQHNFLSLIMNSFRTKKEEKEAKKGNFLYSGLKNEKINSIINKFTDHIADRAAEEIENLIDKVFQKKHKD